MFGHIHEGYGTEVVVFDEQQRLYEAIVKARGGIVVLLSFSNHIFAAYWARRENQRMRLVNAEAVGGLLDERKKQPIIVTL